MDGNAALKGSNNGIQNKGEKMSSSIKYKFINPQPETKNELIHN